MPTGAKVKKVLLSEALPSHIEGLIYELGSGWGTLAFPLAKKYSDSKVIAYETSLIPYWISRGCSLLHKKNNLHFVRQDFFHVNLQKAGLVVCYLYPEAMRKLKEKFKEELKPGTLIITHTFSIPGWQPLQVYAVHDLYQTKIFVYRI
jgi:predicted RNA methylase